MTVFIDLNADLGEGDPSDAELLEVVSSCNVACGGHIGDTQSMQTTVAMALGNGVTVGAHPAYPDREGFGRRPRFVSGAALFESLTEQLHAFEAVCARAGAPVCHIKPHGALYNDAAKDPALAAIVIRSVKALHGNHPIVGPAGSALAAAAQDAGLAFIREAFIDRAYQESGELVSRSVAGAVYTDPDTMAAQAISIVLQQRVQTVQGDSVPVAADTLCIHGDTPNAAKAARHVRDVLQQNGVQIHAAVR